MKTRKQILAKIENLKKIQQDMQTSGALYGYPDAEISLLKWVLRDGRKQKRKRRG